MSYRHRNYMLTFLYVFFWRKHYRPYTPQKAWAHSGQAGMLLAHYSGSTFPIVLVLQQSTES